MSRNANKIANYKFSDELNNHSTDISTNESDSNPINLITPALKRHVVVNRIHDNPSFDNEGWQAFLEDGHNLTQKNIESLVLPQIIGRNNLIPSPFLNIDGTQHFNMKIYCDYTASGQDL